jgi:hypothetical protein
MLKKKFIVFASSLFARYAFPQKEEARILQWLSSATRNP